MSHVYESHPGENGSPKVVCAWCDAIIQAGEGQETSHGICEACYSSLLSSGGKRIEHFIEDLSVPILLVDGSGRATAANSKAVHLVNKPLNKVTGQLGGDIFDCIHSKKPGGCGKTIHCQGCTIRRCVESTYISGQAYIDVPATLKIAPEASEKEIVSRITTFRIEQESGEFAVILTIKGAHFSS